MFLRCRSLAVILFSSVTFFKATCFAYITSSFDIGLGQSAMQVKAVGASDNLNSFGSLEMNYNLRNSSSGIAYSMSFFEFLASNQGALAFTRFSVGPRWYPMGMNGEKVILDNDASARIWKATPFVGMSLGIANLSTESMNVSFMDLTPRLGVELPLTSTTLLVGQFVMASSMNSSSAGVTGASYSGVTASVGIIISDID